MAGVSTYLNFQGNTEEAFNFYAQAFGNEILGIMRLGDMPMDEGAPQIPDEQKNLVINIMLESIDGHMLMGSDAIEGMGPKYVQGTDVNICLMPDKREDADRLFAALSEGGEVYMPMEEQFWGDYYGTFADKFGKNWMINCSGKS